MNLKDAFRYQNFLQSLSTEVSDILSDKANITLVKNTTLRKRVYADAENETLIEEAPSEFADSITALTEFYLSLLEEREKLSGAIREAKNKLPIDMDSEVSLNTKRQEVRSTLMHMDEARNNEVIRKGDGIGYRFSSVNGEQLSYRCDVRQVTVINFDRNVVRRHIVELNQKIDEVSAQIDQCLINSNVVYEAPYNVNETLTTVFETYKNNH